jgi:putative ABC transport system permease protein
MPLLRDLLHSFRTLRKSPGFFLATLACLAIGIGATSAMFTVVQAVLLRPLPYPEPERIVGVWNHLTRMDLAWMEASAPEYLDYVEQARSFQEIAGFYTGLTVTFRGEEGPEPLPAGIATPSLFRLLGARPILGRTFLPEEGQPGRDDVILLSHGFWQRHFGGDPGVLDKSLEVSGQPLRVVGVLPADFRFGGEVDMWGPLAFDPQSLPSRRQRYLNVLGRLRDGLSLSQAQAEMESLAGRLQQQYPEVYEPQGWKLELVPLQERMVGEARPALLMLLGAVAFVLLIACANVANLLLVRATRRRGEIAVRTALGASWGQLLRQILAESCLLGLLGGIAGLGLAGLLLEILVAIQPEGLPRVHEIQLDAAAVLFTLGLALFTGLAFGIVPAFQILGRSLQPLLKEGGRSPGDRRAGGRLRSALVIGEIALAFVLLFGAGLLIESFRRAQAVDPGFDPDRLLTLRVSLPYSKYSESSRVASFQRQLLQQVEALPAVQGAGAVSILPLSGGEYMTSFRVEGLRSRPEEGLPSADLRIVSPEYHAVLEIPLREGRFLSAGDDAQSPPVCLVDQSLARRLWEGKSPLGRRIQLGSSGEGPWLAIVGVVGQVKQDGLERESRGQIYIPHAQRPERSMVLVVRTSGEPIQLAPAVRRAVLELDADQPISEIRPMEEVIAESMASRRFSTALLSAFSGIALLLASLGVYGVMAYSVAQRSREIGLRVALGAQPRNVLYLIVGRGMALAAFGLAVGGLCGLWLSRFLASQLFGVGSRDPILFLVSVLSLAAVALLASYLPARRALSLDPVSVLKSE